MHPALLLLRVRSAWKCRVQAAAGQAQVRQVVRGRQHGIALLLLLLRLAAGAGAGGGVVY
jgi:hypothetical protein